MARLRPEAGSPRRGPIKRSCDASDSSTCQPNKRRHEASPGRGLFRREGPPSKSVHFKQGLTEPATAAGPSHREKSPNRSAWHRRDDTPISATPSQQLCAEAEYAETLNQRQTPSGFGGTRSITPKNPGMDDMDMPYLSPQPSYTRRDWELNHDYGKDRHYGKTLGDGFDFVHDDEPIEELDDTPSETYDNGNDFVHDSDPVELDGTLPSFDDETVCGHMESLVKMVKDFADDCSSANWWRTTGGEFLEDLLEPENKYDQLIRYIGFIGQGGRSHIKGWRELFESQTSRSAVVMGVIGRVLKEHVFSSLYFGAPARFMEELQEMEKEQADNDGFYRSKKRAAAIATRSKSHKHNAEDAAALAQAEHRLTLQLEHLLQPLLSSHRPGDRDKFHNKHRDRLQNIITTATSISRLMRATGDVVYHWTSSYKDEEFDPCSMECFNLADMITTSPYEKKKTQGFDHAILREGCEGKAQAVVRVVCFPGLVAYRQYGGDLAKKELKAEEERRESQAVKLPNDVAASYAYAAERDKLTGKEGYRTRLICKSVVHLQWTKQRLLTREAGTSTHIDAMQGKNGQTMKRYEDDAADFVSLNEVYEAVKGGQSVQEQEAEYERKWAPSSWLFWKRGSTPVKASPERVK